MNEVARVRLFTECFSEPDRLDSVQENLLTQIRALGYTAADVAWCVSQLPFEGRFLCFICVAAVVENKP